MLQQGYELDEYRILDVLGAGGFGITYLAEDETLQVKVAIKEFMPGHVARHDGVTVAPITGRLQTDYERLLENFIAESRHVAKVQHPNVVRVRRCFRRNGTAYMVMEYEEGTDYEQYLRKLNRRPSEAELRRVIAPLLDGLRAVHAAGLVHRDIKPSNIFIRTGDGSPVLLDFGAARRADAAHFTAILTAGYAPIEQYEEAALQGPWTDIYSLAAVVYRAITGSKPPAALNRLAQDRLTPISTICRGEYTDAFLLGIDYGLAVMPAERPASVEDWRGAWLGNATVERREDKRRATRDGDTEVTVSELMAAPTPTTAPGNATAEPAPVIDSEADAAAWVRATSAANIDAYRVYLRAFPAGAFANEARLALGDLELAERKLRQEESDWKRATAIDSAESYRNYLIANPEGAHARQARSAVSVLEDAERRRTADDQAWRDAAAANTIAAYEGYLENFPRGARSAAAETALITLRQAAAKAAAEAAAQAAAAARIDADDDEDELLDDEDDTERGSHRRGPVAVDRGSSESKAPSIFVIPAAADDPDHSHRFDLSLPPVSMVVTLALLGLIVMIIANIILKGLLHGISPLNLVLSFAITAGVGFGYTLNSREVNAFSGAVYSLIAAAGSTILFLILIAMVL